MEPLKTSLTWLCTDPIGILVAWAVLLTIYLFVHGAVLFCRDYVQNKVKIAQAHGFAEGKQAGIAEAQAERKAKRNVQNGIEKVEALANGEL